MKVAEQGVATKLWHLVVGATFSGSKQVLATFSGSNIQLAQHLVGATFS